MSIIFGIVSSNRRDLDHGLVNKVIENAGINGTRKLILHKENGFLFGYPDFFDQRFYDDQHKNSFCLLGGEFFKSDDLEKNKTPESLSPGKNGASGYIDGPGKKSTGGGNCDFRFVE